MGRHAFGAKPSVLRCSRCGKFVDWEQARLQIVCDCRSTIELPPVFVRPVEEADRTRVRELFMSDFGHLTIVAFGEVMLVDQADTLVAVMRGDIAGALAWRRHDEAFHVVALATDPMWQRSGVAGHLLAEAEIIAKRMGLSRLITATSNDNLPSVYFFQRHGFRLTNVVADAFARHARETSVVGFGGIPVVDELQLEKSLLQA